MQSHTSTAIARQGHPAYAAYKISDRPLLTLDHIQSLPPTTTNSNNDSKHLLLHNIVVGSADHSLYLVPFSFSSHPSSLTSTTGIGNSTRPKPQRTKISPPTTLTPKIQALYTKNSHRDWVSTCAISSSHTHTATARASLRIASGGMEGMVLEWGSSGASMRRGAGGAGGPLRQGDQQSCSVLGLHEASVTKVRYFPGPGGSPSDPSRSSARIVASSSYDGTIRFWESSDGSAERCVRSVGKRDGQGSRPTLTFGCRVKDETAINTGNYMKSTKIPILDFAWCGIDASPMSSTSSTSSPAEMIASTREGCLHIYDISQAPAVSSTGSIIRPKDTIAAHRGPISRFLPMQIPQSNRPMIVSAGGSDGVLRVFDLQIPEGKGRGVMRWEGLHRYGDGGEISDVVQLRDGGAGAAERDGGSYYLATTGGGDGTIQVVDMRLPSASGKQGQKKGSSPATAVNSISIVEKSVSPLSTGVGAKKLDPVTGKAFSEAGKTCYAMCDLGGRGGTIATCWGDGNVLVHRNVFLGGSESKEPLSLVVDKFTSTLSTSSSSLNLAGTQEVSGGLRNAIRCVAPLQRASYHGVEGLVDLVGCGDDGIVVHWKDVPTAQPTA